jgi:hypothetical protein
VFFHVESAANRPPPPRWHNKCGPQPGCEAAATAAASATVAQHTLFAREPEMWLSVMKGFLLGVLVISPLGCEPQPVVEPDDDTTVIEERDTVIEDDADAEPQSGVDVNVGGERGVEVGVGQGTDEGAEQPNQNP